MLELRAEPAAGRYLMLFYGSSATGCAELEVYGHACLGLAPLLSLPARRGGRFARAWRGLRLREPATRRSR